MFVAARPQAPARRCANPAEGRMLCRRPEVDATIVLLPLERRESILKRTGAARRGAVAMKPAEPETLRHGERSLLAGIGDLDEGVAAGIGGQIRQHASERRQSGLIGEEDVEFRLLQPAPARPCRCGRRPARRRRRPNRARPRHAVRNRWRACRPRHRSRGSYICGSPAVAPAAIAAGHRRRSPSSGIAEKRRAISSSVACGSTSAKRSGWSHFASRSL